MVSFCDQMVIICILSLRDFIGWFIMIIIIKDPWKRNKYFLQINEYQYIKKKRMICLMKDIYSK